MTPAAYRDVYLAWLRDAPAPAPQGPMPAIAPSVWFPPEGAEPPVSLVDLYDAGVRSGHGESRAALEARLGGYDRALERAEGSWRDATARLDDLRTTLQAEFEDARRLYDRNERELQGEVQAARDRIAVLEGSTSWRVTAPLRTVIHVAKRTVRGIRELPERLRLLHPRMATARNIARDQGMVELARRVASKVSPRGVPAGLRQRAQLESAIHPLHVPTSDTPRISVIVPTYGQDLHTFSCLVALAAEAARVPIEVIVADDCAPMPAADALRGVTGVRFVRNETNLGFLRNCNHAASLGRGEYLLFLNNDALVTPGTLQALLAIFARFPDAGGAGAKLVYPDGRLQEAGAIVWRDGSAWNLGRGEDPDRPEFNYVRIADYCSAACLLVPRQLFHEVGEFDERYVPAYCEDTDLCFKLADAGRPVYYQPAAEAIHFEGVSHGTDTGSGVKKYQVDNQARFRERWAERLARHRPNGILPALERDRDAWPRVLLVEACMLTPDQDSGSLRTWRMLAIMRDMGWKPVFAAANLENREPYISRLRQDGVEVLHAPYVRSIDELLRERGGEFDIIILARYYVAAPHIEAVRRYAPRALLVFDTIDLHYLRNRRLAQLENDAALAQGAEAIHRQEIDCIRRCDVTWVVSDVERDILVREVPRALVRVMSNIHEPVAGTPRFATREGLLFVGGFRHPPNVDAALWLARELVPLWRERLPGVTTYIAGSNVTEIIHALQGDGIEVLGFVPELEPWLEKCRVSVSPLRYGAGVKGKVNQAMAHGLPVVATRMSVEGMRVIEGEEVLVADDAQGFADAVVRLYQDEALWNRIARGSRANIEREFSGAVARRGLEELAAQVMEFRGRRGQV